MEKDSYPRHQTIKMNSLTVLLNAIQVMRNDARLLSPKEDVLFWNERFSGLRREEVTQFNQLWQTDTLDLNRLRTVNDTGNSMRALFDDHQLMINELKEALKLNPKKTDHPDLLNTSQFSFMLIMIAAIKRYHL